MTPTSSSISSMPIQSLNRVNRDPTQPHSPVLLGDKLIQIGVDALLRLGHAALHNRQVLARLLGGGRQRGHGNGWLADSSARWRQLDGRCVGGGEVELSGGHRTKCQHYRGPQGLCRARAECCTRTWVKPSRTLWGRSRSRAS